MKSRKLPITVILSLLWFACLTTPSLAHTVRSRELCGKIISIDTNKGLIDLNSPESEIRHFALNKSVMVVKDWQQSSLSDVQRDRRHADGRIRRRPMGQRPDIAARAL